MQQVAEDAGKELPVGRRRSHVAGADARERQETAQPLRVIGQKSECFQGDDLGFLK